MNEPGATLVMHRKLAWNETDAAGHNHFASAFRWMEEAEHELWIALGCSPDFTERLPRVHIELDYSARILYREAITVTVAVARVGGSSCNFAFLVDKEDGTRAATGKYTVVHVSSTTEGAQPWPAEIREALVTPAKFTVSTVVQRS